MTNPLAKMDKRKRIAVLAGAGIAIAAYIVLRGRGGGSTAGYAGIPVGATGAGAGDGTINDGGAGGSTGGTDLTALEGQISDWVTQTQQRQDELEQLVASTAGDLNSSLQTIYDTIGSQTTGTVDAGATDPGDAAPVDPASAPVTVPPTTGSYANGVNWGGAVYGKNTGDIFVDKELRSKGVNPAAWAKKHPAAAKYLGLDNFKPEKPRSKNETPAGVDYGNGVYRDKNGRLTYKGPKTKKPSSKGGVKVKPGRAPARASAKLSLAIRPRAIASTTRLSLTPPRKVVVVKRAATIATRAAGVQVAPAKTTKSKLTNLAAKIAGNR